LIQFGFCGYGKGRETKTEQGGTNPYSHFALDLEKKQTTVIVGKLAHKAYSFSGTHPEGDVSTRPGRLPFSSTTTKAGRRTSTGCGPLPARSDTRIYLGSEFWVAARKDCKCTRGQLRCEEDLGKHVHFPAAANEQKCDRGSMAGKGGYRCASLDGSCRIPPVFSEGSACLRQETTNGESSKPPYTISARVKAVDGRSLRGP
jgi:hypothetical protein